VQVEPTTGALGAIVTGVDVATVDEAVFERVREALDEHLVIYLPDQSLDRFQLSSLGRRFGPPFLHPIVDNGFDDCPEVLELLRKPEDTHLFGGQSWHADVTWQKPAGYVSILHGLEMPAVGGDTAFASTIAAFETLSDGLRQTLRGLNAVHSYAWSAREIDHTHAVTHPVVRKHPRGGREGLYINRMFTERFEGMTPEESAPLLEYLFAHMERHEFTCRFRWKPGGLLMWDNRFTLHFPINDFSGQRRRMIRTTSLELA